MKLKKLKNSRPLITKLQTLKLSYKKKFFDPEHDSNINQILLNKIIRIIHEYNTENKKILFIGFPKEFDQICQKNKHLRIPESVFEEILNHQRTHNKRTVLPKNTTKLTKKLTKKADLVVIYDSITNAYTINQNYLAFIPIVTISKKWIISNHKYIYESNGNYDFPIEKSASTNLFFSLIKSLL